MNFISKLFGKKTNQTSDITVKLCDSQLAARQAAKMEKLLETNEELNTVSFVVTFAWSPRTGKNHVLAEGLDDKSSRNLETVLEEQSKKQKSIILYVSRDNLDNLKQYASIWSRVKQVIE